MSYLAIDLAIWERLVGAPLDNNGRPVVDADNIPVNRSIPGYVNTEPSVAEESAGIVGPPPLPSYGVRIPMLLSNQSKHRSNYRVASSTHNAQRPPNLATDFAPHNYTQIPVFPQNVEGLDYSQIWPAVTFYWLDTYPTPEFSPYGGYGMEPAASAADVVVKQVGSEPTTGKDRLVYVPAGDAFFASFVIRVYSKYDTELKLICDSIHRLFPTHSALFVERANGTKTAFSMSLLNVENLDVYNMDIPKTIHMDREYSRAFIYEISGTMDNTMMAAGGGLGQSAAEEEHIILHRWLELQQLTSESVQRTFKYGTELRNG